MLAFHELLLDFLELMLQKANQIIVIFLEWILGGHSKYTFRMCVAWAAAQVMHSCCKSSSIYILVSLPGILKILDLLLEFLDDLLAKM